MTPRYVSGAAARLALRAGDAGSPRARRCTLRAAVARETHPAALRAILCLLTGGGRISVHLLNDLPSSRLVCDTHHKDTPSTHCYKHHRFPAEIISHAVSLYFCFCLSRRDVEELLFARGYCQEM
jgi:hypothetical protein